jgi:hypothetical protein
VAQENECFRQVYEPLFFQYGVDAAFSGHVHGAAICICCRLSRLNEDNQWSVAAQLPSNFTQLPDASLMTSQKLQ